MSKITIPRDDLFNPVLQALHRLGGSGTNQEIHDEVVVLMGLSDEQIQLLLNPGKSNKTEIASRLAWARTWLKKYGVIDNPSWGVWVLTKQGQKTTMLDPAEVERAIAKIENMRKYVASIEQREEQEVALPIDSDLDDNRKWREDLYDALLRMKPDSFERLCQRILRESGFSQVEVTGKSGDGGIDGIGVMRIGGFLSFRVLFQCKRYKGSVTAGTVRDFRGAMTGRTDKGLIVTTGIFTRDAVREATRDGAPEIDLVDGEQLVDKLKELSLGVKTEQVMTEQVTVDSDFFANI